MSNNKVLIPPIHPKVSQTNTVQGPPSEILTAEASNNVCMTNT